MYKINAKKKKKKKKHWQLYMYHQAVLSLRPPKKYIL